MKTRKESPAKPPKSGAKKARGKLSLHPLSIEDAIRAAAKTGPMPDKQKPDK
jgi:hypothetical protein